MTDIVLGIAPFVRGLNRLGQTGAFVRCAEGAPGADAGVGILPPLEVPVGSAPDDVFAAAYRKYCADQGRHPAVIKFGADVFVCAGRSYDEAVEIEKRYLETGGTPTELGQAGIGVANAAEGNAIENRSAIVRDRIAVVTGGAQGFGESIVRELVAAGAFVWIADINVQGASALCDELNGFTGKTVSRPVAVNVMDEDSVHAMVDSIVAECGGIDLFISNAGVVKAGSVKELALKDFQFVTSVNYAGYFLCVKHVSPVMALQNCTGEPYFSDIIQINSKSGLEGSNKNGAYAGGKFGGIGLTQSFALELVADNIKINSVCPGNFFDGPLWSDPEKGLFVLYLAAGKIPGAKTVEDVRKSYEAKVPMGRGCTGADVVKAIYYIVDQKYETGQAVPVTGGQVMLR
jgi:sorbitol-6-phosphate 2-dehydrogenase